MNTCAFAVLAAAACASARASVQVFPKDKPAFLLAAPAASVAADFDSIAPGTDIGMQAINGLNFFQFGAPLTVVRGSDTQTPGGFTGAPNPASNKLLPTSGENVLSPGGTILAPGPNAAVENDGLTIVFEPPVKAFGFDHISQSADGFSFTSITVRNSASVPLYTGSIPISDLGGGGAPAGADFWGIVSSQADIASVTISEGDEDSQFPDCNIGFDTILTLREAPCPGDLNADGQVDDADFEMFVIAYNILDCTDPAMPPGCPADLSGDTAVDDSDFELFVVAYNLLLCP